MRVPHISLQVLKKLDRVSRCLQLVFKIGLPVGVVILIGEDSASGLGGPHNHSRGAARVSATAEILLGVACMAFAINCLLEGLVYVWGFAKSIRFAVSGIIPYLLGDTILGSVAIVLWIFAIREWSGRK